MQLPLLSESSGFGDAFDAAFEREQRDWLAQQFDAIPSKLEILRPSEWAERKRYLPPSVTPLPGAYSFELTPYLREIVDCFSVDNPVREVSVMKGSQLGVTVGVFENVLGYLIDHVRTAPVLVVTANDDLAKNRMESNVTPMLIHSDLIHLIKSNEGNARKTGKRDGKLEWDGGGYAVIQGAQSKNNARSLSARFLLLDESDAYPRDTSDGDMMGLLRARTDFFEKTRKIGEVSTPTILGQSNIHSSYLRGDQRKYWVCCLRCSFPQILKFRVDDPLTGVRAGLVWETTQGRLVPDSVRYVCQNPDCNHGHINEDKIRLLSPDNGAEWRPSAVAHTPHHRSYQLSALYAPAGTRSWETIALKWMEAWDDERGRPRDNSALQVFYNNELGEPFELRGEKIDFQMVSGHRRHFYTSGQIPNKAAGLYCGGPILFLQCTVDVHKDNLAVAVWGWTRGARTFLINYWRFEGDTEQIDDPGTWGALRKLISEQQWKADDGKVYRIALALIDSGYRTDTVCTFAESFDDSAAPYVYPVKGRDFKPENVKFHWFSAFPTSSGRKAYGITVDLYKDRLSAFLRRGWDGLGQQPEGHFNAPLDATDAQLKELTVEVKREKIEKTTGKRVGVEWHRPSGAPNELWDLYVYSRAGLDILCTMACESFGFEIPNFVAFYDACEQQKFFFND